MHIGVESFVLMEFYKTCEFCDVSNPATEVICKYCGAPLPTENVEPREEIQ